MESDRHHYSSINDCRLIKLPCNVNERGSIAVAQNSSELPFAIKRIFYIYDIPSDSKRGGHSHYRCEQFIIAVSGSFVVKVFDGKDWTEFTLSRPYMGLYIPAGLWRTLEDFSSGSVCLTLCPDSFDEADYVRDIEKFKDLTKHKNQ